MGKTEGEKEGDSFEGFLKDKDDKMVYKELLKNGWTFLRHGTDTSKWEGVRPSSIDRLHIKRNLSVVDADAVLRGRDQGGYDTARTYSSGGKEGSTPVDLRVIFYEDCVRKKSLEKDNPGMWDGIDDETKKQVAKWYFLNPQMGRHPLVPSGTILRRIAAPESGGKDMVYFIPEDKELVQRFERTTGIKTGITFEDAQAG